MERGARSSGYDEAERGVDTRDSLNNLMRYRISRWAHPERLIDVNMRILISAESARNPRLSDEFRDRGQVYPLKLYFGHFPHHVLAG